MIRIFIGYDDRETAAYHVLSHSILRRASEPVQIVPLARSTLHKHFWRPRGEYDSTDFSNSRWIVPHLCVYEGKAIFMDCDMLCLADIAELWHQDMRGKSVLVKKHNYEPENSTKFLGERQTKYNRKNWSSLIVFDNHKCRVLSRHIVNTMTPGLWFHQFNWLPDDEIGEVEGDWNHLVGHSKSDAPKLLHFTEGGPWHDVESEYADRWRSEFRDMIRGENPSEWASNFDGIG